MNVMKDKGLWPIWPAAQYSEPLEYLLASFSSLGLPVIRADPDTPYEAPSPPRIHRAPRVVHHGWGYGPDGPESVLSPRIPCPPPQRQTAVAPRMPTQHTVSNSSMRLEDLCVGLCLDCSKGNDVCRLPHPAPWPAYQSSLEMWF